MRKKVMKMPRGQKTPPETVYKIMASWAVTGNYQETARQLKVPQSTVEKIVKENKNKPEFVEVCDKKRDEFSKKATQIINKALTRLENELDNYDKDIPINQLTTAIGTLFDKRALVDGEATERMSVEIKLPDGADEYAE